MLQICPKLPNQQFEKLPFKEAILTFLKDLGHSGEIKVITDVNVNKLHQPWRSFVAVINKCLSGAEPPKTKASVKKKQVGSDKSKTPPTAKGKRLKTSAKAAKTAKKKQPAKTSKAKGLTVLSEVALTKAEQMKLAIKRSLIETYSSLTSGSGADEGTGEEDDDDGEDNDNQDDDNEQTDSDNNEDIHEEGSDLRVHTPSHYESTDDEDNDEEIKSVDVEEEEMDEVNTNKEKEVDELYRDVNVNLEGRDTKMTDAPPTIIQTTQVIEDTHVIITSVNPEDVPVTTIVEPPLLTTTILPPPPTPLITHLQQTPVHTPATVPSSSLQDLPNFGSLFGFDHRLKTLENEFSEFKQTN
ncbi:hypothetical protein Tco_0583483 [Tanacetum coccineum]